MPACRIWTCAVDSRRLVGADTGKHSAHISVFFYFWADFGDFCAQLVPSTTKALGSHDAMTIPVERAVNKVSKSPHTEYGAACTDFETAK